MTHYWKSLEELEGGPEFAAQAETEFADSPLKIAAGPDRRGFLKKAGKAAATVPAVALLLSANATPAEAYNRYGRGGKGSHGSHGFKGHGHSRRRGHGHGHD